MSGWTKASLVFAMPSAFSGFMPIVSTTAWVSAIVSKTTRFPLSPGSAFSMFLAAFLALKGVSTPGFWLMCRWATAWAALTSVGASLKFDSPEVLERLMTVSLGSLSPKKLL